jgi:hypothetical protein
MVKPAVAATISMAIYQKKSVAARYLNFGYLIMIVSVTTVPILPRGKFLLNLFMSVVSYLLLNSFPIQEIELSPVPDFCWLWLADSFLPTSC